MIFKYILHGCKFSIFIRLELAVSGTVFFLYGPVIRITEAMGRKFCIPCTKIRTFNDLHGTILFYILGHNQAELNHKNSYKEMLIV